MSECYLGGGAEQKNEVYLYSGSPGNTTVTVNCGFSSKAGTIGIFGTGKDLMDSNFGVSPGFSTSGYGITGTDNLNGTVTLTIATGSWMKSLNVAIIKTLT